MTPSVFRAAQQLQRRIVAAPGAVNTLAQAEGEKPIIRVLIDPLYWNTISSVPSTFKGFRVVVEKRQQSQATYIE
jgi:hypothetical protein